MASRPLCPFCAKAHNFNQSRFCPETQWEVPERFIQEYSKAPPLWVVSVGFTGHGKTVFLSAVTLMLENVSVAWPDASYRYLDDETRSTVARGRAEARKGEQPAPTTFGRLRPLLITLKGVPDFGDRSTVIYDAAGEVFIDVQNLATTLKSIKYVKTIWFLISLADLPGDDGRTMVDLFDVYTDAMAKAGVNLKGRTMIVVFTKADRVMNFPRIIQDYIINDPLRDLTNTRMELPDLSDFDIRKYIRGMETISKELEEHTRRRVHGGAAFLASAKREGMQVYFTVTSALGRDASRTSKEGTVKALQEDATRFRVLDPLIWSLHLQPSDGNGDSEQIPPTPEQELVLVFDSSSSGDILYQENVIEALGNQLDPDITINTYYLGFVRRTNNPGELPANRKSRYSMPRLIGPLLDYLASRSSAAKVVVLTGAMIDDLKDYERSDWNNRMMVVGVAADIDLRWSNTFRYDPTTNDVSALVDAIEQLLNERKRGR